MSIVSVSDFFYLVLEGDMGDLDVENYIQNVTDNYNLKKLKKLLNDIEYLMFVDKEEKLGEYSNAEILNAITELKKKNKELPYIRMIDIFNKDDSKEEKIIEILDTEKLMFPFRYTCIYPLIGEIKYRIRESEKNVQTNNQNIVNENQDKTANNVLVSTIEDWLFEFKEFMSDSDYNILILALKEFFEKGKFPKIDKQIKVKGKVNKKVFGWALNQIYRSEGKGNISKEYLLFAKQHISLFADVDFNESEITKCNLYKYFTTKPT